MNKEVEYLKEHLYEIYKYKKSMKDLTYDMDIEHLLRTCKALDYQQKEIQKSNNIINELEKELLNYNEILNNGVDKGCVYAYLGSPLQLVERCLNKIKELKEK